LVETVSANVQESWLVYLFSKSSEARLRIAEVNMALVSTKAQQLQEEYSMKFASTVSNVFDLSHDEGAARLYSFGVRFNTLRAYEKTRVIDYFDKFPIPPEIHTNQ
jgi:hypothetical protein